MDYVTRQFINLTKKFRKEFRKLSELLRKDIQEHTKAIRAQSKSDKDRQNQLPIPVQLKFEEDEITERQTQNLRQNAILDSTRRATWFTFIAASIYAAITLGIWLEMNIQNINQSTANMNSGATADRTLGQVQRTVADTHELAIQAGRQATAAERSATASQDSIKALKAQFRADERPWVVPTTNLADPQQPPTMVELDSSGKPTGNIVLNVVITVQNVGKTPAIDLFNTFAEFKKGPLKVVTAEVKNYAPVYGTGDGTFVAQNQSPIVIASDHFVRLIHTTDFEKVKTGEWVVYIVGGVKYTDTSTPKIPPYETRYCYRYHPNGLPWGVCPFGFSIK